MVCSSVECIVWNCSGGGCIVAMCSSLNCSRGVIVCSSVKCTVWNCSGGGVGVRWGKATPPPSCYNCCTNLLTTAMQPAKSMDALCSNKLQCPLQHSIIMKQDSVQCCVECCVQKGTGGHTVQ